VFDSACSWHFLFWQRITVNGQLSAAASYSYAPPVLFAITPANGTTAGTVPRLKS
jgi:hypothetical protein